MVRKLTGRPACGGAAKESLPVADGGRDAVTVKFAHWQQIAEGSVRRNPTAIYDAQNDCWKIQMFTVTSDNCPEHPRGSTVSIGTLKREGYVPKIQVICNDLAESAYPTLDLYVQAVTDMVADKDWMFALTAAEGLVQALQVKLAEQRASAEGIVAIK